MKCPICQKYTIDNPNQYIKDIAYNKCFYCGCIFTHEDISSVLITQNKGNNVRNTDEMNSLRLKRISEHNPKFENIIDFGCGQGEFLNFISTNSHVGNTIGIDLNTKLQLSDLKSNRYDVINCVEVIEHIIDPKPIIEEFKRVLRPGGIVYLETGVTDVLPKYEGLEEQYINPEIGHVLIHSEKSLEMLFEGFKMKRINDFVFVFQKSVIE